MRSSGEINLGNDPFLTHVPATNSGTGYGTAGPGRPAPKGTAPKKTQQQLVTEVAGIPFVLFLLITGAFTFLYHGVPGVCWLLVILGLFIGIINGPFRVNPSFAKGIWEWLPLAMCWFASIMAMLVGMYNYSHHMAAYYTYKWNRSYSNVLPSESAGSHADAGKIVFSDSARVDITKAVGFYDEGHIYCAAPILDQQPATPDTNIGFWAVGVDCCGFRSKFFCDDALDPQAKSGVVEMPETTRLEQLIWGEEAFETKRAVYMKAMLQAAAVYDLAHTESEPVFVRWVKSPEKAEHDALVRGCMVYGIASLVFLTLAIITGMGAMSVKGLVTA